MKDFSLFLKALHFAADKHRDQRRKDEKASPYINHPIYVAQILADICGIDDVEVLCGAVLHDTVEDTKATLNDIELAFGLSIARIVEEVTDDKSLAKAERKQAQIDHAAHISREGALVKVADKIANIRDVASNPPSDWKPKRRREYLDWAEEVVANCKPGCPELVSFFEESLVSARKALDS
jgi:guanosine-3',5'-bis(diphosphate) 3'-pyrophosphohydrolase